MDLNKCSPVFVFNSLDSVRGGLTKAVLTRANFLINKYDNVIFLTLAFQQNYHEIIEKLYENGSLDRRVKVLNFFDDLKNVSPQEESSNVESSVEEDGLQYFKDPNNELPSYRYYQNGVYVKYKRFDSDGRLLLVDYMSEGRHRLRREEYDELGHISRIRHMDLVKNKPKLDRYVDSEKNCFLSVWIDSSNKKQGRTLYLGKDPKEYGSLYDAYINWVSQKLKSIDNPIVMSDSRFTDGLVTSLKNKNIKRIAILHNNHFNKPFDGSEGIKSTWSPFLKNISKYDNVVFLTEEQKNDIGEFCGNSSKYTVIPHSAQKVETKTEKPKDYHPYSAVTLARYNSQKRLDEAIRAFSYVVKEIPDAQYFIYGFGGEQSKLENLIGELKLQKNVHLKGFTTDPTATYQSAACSILTSDYEGFGLVMTESMAAGTPVVAYDVKYGPKDIIKDNIDGFLVPKGNKKKLADRIITLMKDQTLRNSMGEKAYEVVNRFSFEKYEENWFNLLEKLNREIQDEINNPIKSSAVLDSYGDNKKIRLTLEIGNNDMDYHQDYKYNILIVNRYSKEEKQKPIKCENGKFYSIIELDEILLDNTTWDFYLNAFKDQKSYKKRLKWKDKAGFEMLVDQSNKIYAYETKKNNYSIHVVSFEQKRSETNQSVIDSDGVWGKVKGFLK
ncbi:glycosyltransferase [Halobacillus amylolyticus]|uniref:Glycosyltransferase n=1 Tax=Halobacillus amylolyticus TaxID=2932259 RepID=A0ABY4H9W1_9BACI|nr:glycosyltransferase [Halobacillus amylolyticus]UOR11646.1 glycosyltransferase [Halobacillus amylolyticus]